MSTTHKQDWIRALENLRFDLVRHDPLQAHKEYTLQHVVDVTVDDSGQIRMTITRQTTETRNEKRKSQTGREYLVFLEHNTVTIVNYRLGTDDELRTILEEMEKVGNRQ